jgi:hypothetical protein
MIYNIGSDISLEFIFEEYEFFINEEITKIHFFRKENKGRIVLFQHAK